MRSGRSLAVSGSGDIFPESNLPGMVAPYLIYLGDTPMAELAKTGAGLAYWRPERCVGQLREPGCAADLSLPDLSLAEAVSDSQGLDIGLKGHRELWI